MGAMANVGVAGKAGGIVAYYRVSTRQQGESGLGLEGQVAAVAAYAKKAGLKILRAYREVESGKRADRPELARALAHARRARATLVIAKLDRLARNVHFLSGLMEAGVDFIACDNENANRLTIHILASVAEDEAKRISERTKAALAAYKARGGLLGSRRPGGKAVGGEAGARGRAASIAARREKAAAKCADLHPRMAAWRAEGLSLSEVADRLNAEGEVASRGGTWSKTQVARVLDRALGD